MVVRSDHFIDSIYFFISSRKRDSLEPRPPSPTAVRAARERDTLELLCLLMSRGYLGEFFGRKYW